jgi:hypothetical protein
LSLLLLSPDALYAQIPVGTGTMITLSPSSPAPEQSFKARVEAYSYDLPRSRISWSVGGSARAEYDGMQEIALQAPALGTPMTIAVTVTEQSGAVHSVKRVVVPSAVDIIAEGLTRIPHFYRGRALPSAGSDVRLVAMPSLYTASGAPVAPSGLLYTWRIGGQLAQSGPGRQSVTATMPQSGPLSVEVTAETADGSASHTSITEIEPAEPRMRFYEDNPLHGLSQNALPTEFTLLEDEISVRAEPYFVSPGIFNNARYEWSINNAPVQNPNTSPETLTLRKTGASGSALVAFSIRNLSSLLQAASGAFTVSFE